MPFETNFSCSFHFFASQINSKILFFLRLKSGNFVHWNDTIAFLPWGVIPNAFLTRHAPAANCAIVRPSFKKIPEKNICNLSGWLGMTCSNTLFAVSSVLGDFHMSTNTSVQNILQVFWFLPFFHWIWTCLWNQTFRVGKGAKQSLPLQLGFEG